jgi:hypothetical protein
MNKFVQATNASYPRSGKTFNNATTLKTSGNPCLDFFNAAGNRNAQLGNVFDVAQAFDPKVAFRIALWTRDVRGGAGERATFRNLLLHFEKHYKTELITMLPKVPELGRWDDLLIFTDKQVRDAAFSLIRDALINGRNGLCAKWMPRKGNIANELRRFMDLTPKAYRKLLVRTTTVVETQMCANKWNEIVFDHVPSVASARYQKAFGRHAPSEYTTYKEGLVKVKDDGTTERKINAEAVFPYDVIRSIEQGDREVAKAQWNALKNWLGDTKIMPLVDVSGSMESWSYYGQRSPIKSKVTPMDISTSLGLYVATKQTGAFNGMFLTFESQPEMQQLKGDIVAMHAQMKRAPWGGSTNIEAAFKKILDTAKSHSVPAEDMPDYLLILSDMEFDSCVEDSGAKRMQWTNRGWEQVQGVTNYENLVKLYQEAGYPMPKVVFWAINGRADNNPVTFKENGTAIVSGFSPAIFKSILSAKLETFTPESVMLETVNVARYDVPGLTV